MRNTTTRKSLAQQASGERPRKAVPFWIMLAALLLPALAGGAAFPPDLRFRSLTTARVTVHYHQGLESMAREAAALATQILEAHEARYGAHVGRVQILLSDVEDEPNGFATPFPYPLVGITAAAPDGGGSLGNHEGWLRVVLTHELAHIVHLDQARGIVDVGRRIFGRSPLLFPNLNTPTWMTEGLATYEETRGTAFGRGRSSDSRMVLRMAALEGNFPSEDRPAVRGLDLWPGGQAPYLFGESFLREMTERFGHDTLPELARIHSGRLIPYFDDLTSKKVTGASFHSRWQEWKSGSIATFQQEAEKRRARGLTLARPVTSRGIRQLGPHFSPDGAWIAYTNSNLTRFPAIHLVRLDGSGDRRLVLRNGGSSLSWTPDGRSIVFDEPEIHRFFAERSDLRVVDVNTGRVRKLTRGLRARDPDVSPDGRTIVFVRRLTERSELATIGLDGSGLQDLTQSERNVQWSHPHWNPRGDTLVAARWKTGGWLDLVQIDPATGAAVTLTEDRARDLEPTWTPDGRHVVFRSDRDGVSNLYALRLADGALLRVTNVLGGASTPTISPDGAQVAFSNYSSRGYDVHVAQLDLARSEAAPRFEDPYPQPRAAVESTTAPSQPYRPFEQLLPRFWIPSLQTLSGDTRVGVLTAGIDPLQRHYYSLEVHRGTETGRFGFRGFYEYDRFWPTLAVNAEDIYTGKDAGRLHRTELTLSAAIPLQRSFRSSQTLALTWHRRHETPYAPGGSERLDLGGLGVSWSLSTAKRYPLSISPVDGCRLSLGYVLENPAFGSEVSLGKATADARAYLRGVGEADTLALRLGGGTTFGGSRFRRSFAVGGLPGRSLFDLVSTGLLVEREHEFLTDRAAGAAGETRIPLVNNSVLRGYPDDAFTGRSFAQANLEYRFPLAHPERGFRLLPIFLRHLHAAVFADAAHAWSENFRLRDVKTSAGVALGADVYLGHVFPLTGTLGVARGFAEKGETRVYFQFGLAF